VVKLLASPRDSRQSGEYAWDRPADFRHFGQTLSPFFRKLIKIDPHQKDERNISMAFYLHAGDYKPRGISKAVKYSPLNVAAQYLRCNKFLHGSLGTYSIALEKRYGFGVLQTLEWQAKLHFNCTMPLLEKMTAVAKLGAKEYFIFYESIRPKEEKELPKAPSFEETDDADVPAG
jgi:hypothetical protein